MADIEAGSFRPCIRATRQIHPDRAKTLPTLSRLLSLGSVLSNSSDLRGSLPCAQNTLFCRSVTRVRFPWGGARPPGRTARRRRKRAHSRAIPAAPSRPHFNSPRHPVQPRPTPKPQASRPYWPGTGGGELYVPSIIMVVGSLNCLHLI